MSDDLKEACCIVIFAIFAPILGALMLFGGVALIIKFIFLN